MAWNDNTSWGAESNSDTCSLEESITRWFSGVATVKALPWAYFLSDCGIKIGYSSFYLVILGLDDFFRVKKEAYAFVPLLGNAWWEPWLVGNLIITRSIFSSPRKTGWNSLEPFWIAKWLRKPVDGVDNGQCNEVSWIAEKVNESLNSNVQHLEDRTNVIFCWQERK